MRRIALVLALLLPACGVAGNTGGGGDEGPQLPPAEAVPALEGLWCGPGADVDGPTIGAICIRIDAMGQITRIVFEGEQVDAVGTIQTTGTARVFRFALSNGGAGFLLLSPTEQHLLYLDNTRLLCVLDSTSPNLPASYLRADINDDWAGTSLFLNDAGDVMGTAASGMSVLPAFGFNGVNNSVAYQQAAGSTLVVTQAVFGRYEARYNVPTVELGDMLLFMSPDKQCVGGTLCADGGSFPDACSIVIWERVP